MTVIPTAEHLAQAIYQVRFDWGPPALAALAPAHVVVLVDALPAGDTTSSADTIAALLATVPPGPDGPSAVVRGTLANRGAVARWVLARQLENGGRTSVALVAVGDTRADGSTRFAVEDHLAAGAIVDALAALGIDHTSPDAAVASAAYAGLARATVHLFSASASGRALRDAGRADVLAAASRVDTDDLVEVLVGPGAGA